MSNFHSLRVKEVKKETAKAVSIVFDVPDKLTNEFKFIPGQYIVVKKDIEGEEVRRAYSICSSPTSGELRIAVKAVSNGTFSVFATTLLKEGDTLEISKPEGKFILNTSKDRSNNYLGIAAGSGITPVMAMVKATLSEEPNSLFVLIYGNKTPADTIFKSEIDSLKNNYPAQFQIQYIFSRAHIGAALSGRIDKNMVNFILKNKLKDIAFDAAFLCGPETMITSAKETLVENGFDENNILFELFSVPVTEKEPVVKFGTQSEITIIVDDEETTFIMDPKTTILSSALNEGIDAPYSCQGGICSSCLAKITAGEAVMDKNTILTDAEVNEGLILTCQAHPTTQKITINYDEV